MAKTVFEKCSFLCGRPGSRFGRPGGRLPLLCGRFLSRLSRAGCRANCCGLTLENPRFWAEKWPEKPQIGGEINGIWPWERKVSKINKFSNRSTDQNLLKRTRFTDRSKSKLGLFLVEIFEFLKNKKNLGVSRAFGWGKQSQILVNGGSDTI